MKWILVFVFLNPSNMQTRAIPHDTQHLNEASCRVTQAELTANMKPLATAEGLVFWSQCFRSK